MTKSVCEIINRSLLRFLGIYSPSLLDMTVAPSSSSDFSMASRYWAVDGYPESVGRPIRFYLSSS
jgi:hypothetical protein